MNKAEMVQISIKQLKKSGFEEIKAKISGYEDPDKVATMQSNSAYVPDIMAHHYQGTYLFDVVPGNNINKEHAKNRWQALSNYALSKNGKLFIVIQEQNRDSLKKLLWELDLTRTSLLAVKE